MHNQFFIEAYLLLKVLLDVIEWSWKIHTQPCPGKPSYLAPFMVLWVKVKQNNIGS